MRGFLGSMRSPAPPAQASNVGERMVIFSLARYLATLLESENTVELYGKVLDRLAGDCGRDLVDRSMVRVDSLPCA